MHITDGWRFNSADFSIQASGSLSRGGTVLLVRDPDSKKKWHQMPEEYKEDEEGPELYVMGYGLTFEEALYAANKKAKNAQPIYSNE